MRPILGAVFGAVVAVVVLTLVLRLTPRDDRSGEARDGAGATPPAAGGPRGLDAQRVAAERDALKAKQAELAQAIEDLRKEKAALTQRLADLERQAKEAAARPVPPPTPAGEPSAAPPAPESKPTRESVAAAFEKVADEGLFAYGTPALKKIEEQVKALGKDGLAFLFERLEKDERSAARFLVAAMLEDLADPAAVPALEKALKDDGESIVRRMAAHALAVSHTADSFAALDDAMRHDKDWGVRANSAYGLAKAGKREGLDELVKFYQDPNLDAQVKPNILGGLMDVADPSTAPIFRDLLKSQKEIGFQLMAIKALEKMKDTGSLEDLNLIINSSPNDSVKAAARAAYNAISGEKVYR